MRLNSRNNEKINFLGIDINELIKYKKSIYIRNISLVFLVLYFIINSFINVVSGADNFTYLNILLLIFLIITYAILLKSILKILNRESLISNALYSPDYLNKVIRSKGKIDEGKSLKNIFNIEGASKDEILSVRKLVNNMELSMYLKYLLPLIFILTIAVVSLMYSIDKNILDITATNLISPKNIVLFGLIFLTWSYLAFERANNSFKFQSKVKSKIMNNVKKYYQYGCLDDIDFKIIEREYKLLFLKNSISKENCLSILQNYDIKKRELVESYIELKVKDDTKMFSLIIIIVLAMIIAIFTNATNLIAIPLGFFLATNVENKIISRSKNKLMNLINNEKELNSIFDKICSNPEYFQYCINIAFFKKNKPLH